MSCPSFVEAIESRVFLSATPALFTSAVKADRLVVQIKLLKFQSDALRSEVKLLNNLRTMKKDVAAGDTSLAAPLKTLQADSKKLSTALREDRLTQSANSLAIQSTIQLDLLQILKDKGNQSAEPGDHAKLLSGRIALQNALITGLDTRIATRESYETTIANDTQAIVTAVDNDSQASAALKLAASRFADTRTTRLATLTADLQQIEMARTKLANDLTAEQT